MCKAMNSLCWDKQTLMYIIISDCKRLIRKYIKHNNISQQINILH